MGAMSSVTRKQTQSAEPATKDDVRSSQEELATMMAESFATVASKDDLTREISTVNSRLDKVEENMATKDMVARIFALVESLDANMKGIPSKVERLQQRVFGSRR